MTTIENLKNLPIENPATVVPTEPGSQPETTDTEPFTVLPDPPPATNAELWAMLDQIHRECFPQREPPADNHSQSARQPVPRWTRHQPEPGEVRLRDFLTQEARARGVSRLTIWHRINDRHPDYEGLKLRRPNCRVVYVKPVQGQAEEEEPEAA